MPTKLKREEVSAERATVAALLAQANDVGDLLGARQFERRLRALDAEMVELGQVQERKASAALFFGGPKVAGSRGIEAEFAGEALERFQDLVSKSFARRELGNLAARGRVPIRSDSKLMVTAVTRGSFGFVLEEVGDQEEALRTQLNEVVGDVVDFVAQVSDPAEEVFLEAVADVDARTLIAIREFFNTLSGAQATLRIVEGDREVALGRDDVQRGKERTEGLEVTETESVRLRGLLLGLLPVHRRFEFVLEGEVEAISGKVAADASRALGDQVLVGQHPVGRRWEAEFDVREVTRPGRPARRFYTLLSLIRELEEPAGPAAE
ncbi:hypothetical protein [Lysobacter arvi]|uniref:Uncharacterized protein n=1 Tax=Lysobacter arvi TaxID=3038776 RepID=A0ABU1CEN1_9GAMM|nr:hypothetical protein [Lysobacter arvi]MDR0183249.1 hypothetical protein [Lysobacter arvi]